jgi:hypothetical protein
VGLGYGAWLLLIRPPQRETQRPVRTVVAADDSLGFFSVAGEGIDLEIIAPNGSRASTSGVAGASARIEGAESSVDCPDFAPSGRREVPCTASILIRAPLPGDYWVVSRSGAIRSSVLSVGWATKSDARRGAFAVTVQVAAGGATSFSVIVARDNVSQRSEPRAGLP